jgi:hypothetical protein
MGLVLSGFEGTIHNSGHFRGGGAYKSRLFWAQMAFTTLVPFQGPKSLDF